MQKLDLAKDLTLLISRLAPLKKGEKRLAKEREAVRNLLSEYLGESSQIAHYSNGKPYLSEHQELSISISHSDNDVALLLAPCSYTLGLDIEDLGEQVLRVRHKFLDESEEQVIQKNKDEKLALHFAWSAKESLYKALNPSEPYLSSFKIQSLNLNPSTQTAEISISYKKQNYLLQGCYTSDFVLTYISLVL